MNSGPGRQPAATSSSRASVPAPSPPTASAPPRNVDPGRAGHPGVQVPRGETPPPEAPVERIAPPEAAFAHDWMALGSTRVDRFREAHPTFDGRGVLEASQTRLDYLPEHATDFAFASLGEQRGFVGCSVLLLLYLLVVWRGLRVVTVAGDLYSAVVAGALVFGFLFQVFVNAGMTMGVAPVTGIPLPFIAVGGTSMVPNLVLIGVLQGIHARGVQPGRAP